MIPFVLVQIQPGHPTKGETMDNPFKDFKIEFAPGCFDNFEGSQEELDELVADLKGMIEDGSFFEKATLVTEDSLEDLPPELLESILSDLEMLDSDDDDAIEQIAEQRRKTLN